MATQNTDFGSCWSCVTDLTMPATIASGFRVVAEAIARRWQTPRGGLLGDPNYGTNLSGYVNDDIDRSGLIRLAKEASSEAEKDQRVLTCDVVAETNANGDITVTGKVTTADGPFSLVVSISQVTVQLLQVA